MSRYALHPSLARRLWTLVVGHARRSRRRGANPIGMRLATTDRVVPASQCLYSPTLAAAVVEDACWALAKDCWLARKPPVWQLRARLAWRAESAGLDRKRTRVVALLDETIKN